MDMTDPTKVLPRWVGVILGFILPGSAHFLSGERKAGLLWFLAVLLCGFTGHGLAAIPAKAMVYAGLALNFIGLPALYVAMLCTSFRHVPRLRGLGWLAFAGALVAMNLLVGLISDSAPAKPFRVPTGAMEPTLKGVRYTEEIGQTSSMDFLLDGKTYREYRAKASGRLENLKVVGSGLEFTIGGVAHKLPVSAAGKLRPQHGFEQGDIIFAGTVYEGDHIVIERLSYLFEKPRRGDIVVFKTSGIDHASVKKDTVYVKRIVGLPGETIQIDPPHVLANGKRVAEPAILQTLHYQNGGMLESPQDSITLGEDEYLVMGDKTEPGMSLDGRYFGAIPGSCIIGRVSTIYWPLNRIGAVR